MNQLNQLVSDLILAGKMYGVEYLRPIVINLTRKEQWTSVSDIKLLIYVSFFLYIST